MQYDEVLRQAETGRVLPVYLVHGGEPLLEQELIQGLRRHLVEPAREALDFHVFGGDQLGQALLVAQTVPFFYDADQNRPRRLVVVRDCPALAAARARAEDGDGPAAEGTDEGQLLAYLDHPPPFTCLVLTPPEGRADARRKLTRRLTDMGAAVECRPLQPRRQNRAGREDAQQVSRWVQERARQVGKEMGDDAVGLLVERVGGDLQTLQSELEKLALYVGDRPAITAADIRAVVVGTTDDELFPLLDAVGFGQPGDAVMQFRQLLRGPHRSEEVARRTLAALTAHMRRLVAARALSANRVSHREAAQRHGGHPFYWEKLYKQVRRRSREQLVDGLERVLQANLALNSGGDPERTMELLLVALAGRG